MKRSADNKLKVVAVRVNPQVEHRLRLLAEATGRNQSFFLQQIIERGIDAMEETWRRRSRKSVAGIFLNCSSPGRRPISLATDL
ncbi:MULTISPECIES: hypothetical protein [Paraburkholderia]|uniref:hypothetical protein n=1 Tax=Paraburkholderia TaxID=1822464 RepID=UPI0028AEA8E2|nr:hypothetical protein [Paraburkholderia podalyriae]